MSDKSATRCHSEPAAVIPGLTRNLSVLEMLNRVQHDRIQWMLKQVLHDGVQWMLNRVLHDGIQWMLK
jgi:hypothetical protein